MSFCRTLQLRPEVNASAPFCCRVVRLKGVRIPTFQSFLLPDLLFWNIWKEETKHDHLKATTLVSDYVQDSPTSYQDTISFRLVSCEKTVREGSF